MMRVTVRNEVNSTTIEVEGKLTSDWVLPVFETWTRVAAAGKQIVLNLSDVSAVDSHGRRLLMEMHRRGVHLVGSGLVIRALIEEILAD